MSLVLRGRLWAAPAACSWGGQLWTPPPACPLPPLFLQLHGEEKGGAGSLAFLSHRVQISLFVAQRGINIRTAPENESPGRSPGPAGSQLPPGPPMCPCCTPSSSRADSGPRGWEGLGVCVPDKLLGDPGAAGGVPLSPRGSMTPGLRHSTRRAAGGGRTRVGGCGCPGLDGNKNKGESGRPQHSSPLTTQWPALGLEAAGESERPVTGSG